MPVRRFRFLTLPGRALRGSNAADTWLSNLGQHAALLQTLSVGVLASAGLPCECGAWAQALALALTLGLTQALTLSL